MTSKAVYERERQCTQQLLKVKTPLSVVICDGVSRTNHDVGGQMATSQSNTTRNKCTFETAYLGRRTWYHRDHIQLALLGIMLLFLEWSGLRGTLES